MSEFNLGPEVRRLVASHLASMDHVEVLILLYRSAPAALPLGEIVSRTARPLPLIENALRDLTTGGLVADKSQTDSERLFAYEPQSDSLRGVVDELVAMYNERPVTLVRAIYDRPAQPVISFADAFRIRGGGN